MADRDVQFTIKPRPPRAPKPGDNSCGAQVRVLLDAAKAHVCARVAGHLYVPNACIADYTHHCACGATFTTPPPDSSCSVPGERGEPICVRQLAQRVCAGCPRWLHIAPEAEEEQG